MIVIRARDYSDLRRSFALLKKSFKRATKSLLHSEKVSKGPDQESVATEPSQDEIILGCLLTEREF